jgi:ribonuclease HI
MQATSPHFLLYSDAQTPDEGGPSWSFVLQSLGGNDHLVATDVEPDTKVNRLELLAVVRGLEALDQPSRVTLLTRSRYVSRGISRGLSQWRDREWRWERFGKLVPIRDHDLWRRLDRALAIHHVECCRADLEPAVAEAAQEPALFANAGRAPRCAMLGNAGQGQFSNIFCRLRHAVVASLTSIWSPAFTRAA